MIKTFVSLFLIVSSFTINAQDFCQNLPKILNTVKFDSSFTSILGAEISKTSENYGDGDVVTTTYRPAQELIPGNAGVIIFQDYPGIMDFWTYEQNVSIVYDKEGQLTSGQWWADQVKKCLENESGWKYKEEEMQNDYKGRLKVWTATKPLDTHFGFKVMNVIVTVFEEIKDYKSTGRYGVKIEVL